MERGRRRVAVGHEVRDAAQAAGLDRFIAAQPDGYATIVGERGAALSAGERQRIAIARALVARAELLILDEPTAALDAAAERDILDGYMRAMRGRTTIVITHRAALAAAADRVFTLGEEMAFEDAERRTSDAELISIASGNASGANAAA